MTLRVWVVPLITLPLAWALASAQPMPGARAPLGEKLYSTHCSACHTSQVHWREKRIAKDWTSLVAQVRRWQSNSGLTWTDEEIFEVARYLNVRYYHFAEKDMQASLSDPSARLAETSIASSVIR